eukprot:scaffold212028_cov17-Tisochrysis_lutea.AAC.2
MDLNGCRYEGEFQVGYAHGLGQFTSENRGEVYIGEYFAGQRHGWVLRQAWLSNVSADGFSLIRPVNFARSACRYRNKALGSDYEDEVVLHAVRDDLDDPYAVLMKNAQHEAKIRDWQGMTAQEK